MLDGTRLLAFVTTALAVIVVPGPSVLFVVARGVALGRRAALVTVMANAAGFAVLVVLVAAGLGPLLERSDALLVAVKLGGAVYLVWLGVKAIRGRRSLVDALGRPVRPSSMRTIVREGFVVGVLNPKAARFLAAILPQFVIPGAVPVALQIAMLGLVFVLVALVCDSVWGLVAGSARERLVGRPRLLEALGAVGGGVVVALGLRLAFSARTP